MMIQKPAPSHLTETQPKLLLIFIDMEIGHWLDAGNKRTNCVSRSTQYYLNQRDVEPAARQYCLKHHKKSLLVAFLDSMRTG